MTVDSIVSAPARYRHLLESCLSEQPLTETPESAKGQCLNHRKKTISVIHRDREVSLLGGVDFHF